MFNRLQQGFHLAGQCWEVLKKDRELMLFPVFSTLAAGAMTAGFAYPAFLFFGEADFDDPVVKASAALAAFTFYFLATFVITFFNVALLHCAKIRFRGGDPTLSDGFRAGFSNLGPIFSWSLLGGLIGVVLDKLEESGAIGRFLSGLLGGAWGVVSYFALPVMIFERKGPIQAIQDSGKIIRETWGEALGGYLGLQVLSQVMGLGAFLGLAGAAVVGWKAQSWVAFGSLSGVVILALLACSAAVSAMTQIYRASLYVYATTGEVPGVMDEELIKGAFH